MQNLVLLVLTVLADATLPARTPIGADGKAVADGGIPLGIAQCDCIAGDAVPVDVLGTSQALAGGDIAVGDAVKVGGGKIVAGATSANVIGRALSAGAAGDLIEILLIPRAV